LAAVLQQRRLHAPAPEPLQLAFSQACARGHHVEHPRIEDGYLSIPEAPVVGLSLNESELRANPYRAYPPRALPTHDDEALTPQGLPLAISTILSGNAPITSITPLRARFVDGSKLMSPS
jgi:hypothetical protein